MLVFSIPELGVKTGGLLNPGLCWGGSGVSPGCGLESEREVEMHFVSPLFEWLGYSQSRRLPGSDS